MASCGRHELGSDDDDGDGAADRHDPAVQAVMEERQRQRATGNNGVAPAAAAAVVVVPAPLPTSTAEQRAEAQRMRAGAAARTRASGWYHAQEQRRVVAAAAAANDDGGDSTAAARRRQHLWASQNAAAISGGGGGEADPKEEEQQQQQQQQPQPLSDLPQCKKCKAEQAVAWLRQHEPLCGACARDGALGKARANLRGAGRLRVGDRVMAALSGGYGSLGMLAALMQMRASEGAATVRPERGRVAFDSVAVHVRELALEWLPLAPAAGPGGAGGAVATAGKQGNDNDDDDNDDSWQRDPAVAEARQRAERRADALEQSLRAALRAIGYSKEDEENDNSLIVLRLEDVFSLDEEEQQNGAGGNNNTRNLRCLQRLLSCVRDPTAREDLAEALRDRLLRHAASTRGCDALALGDTAGTVARRVVAAAAKGRCFALPAEVAAAAVAPGAAASLAVLRPVRDVTAAELAVSFRHESGWPRSPEQEAALLLAKEEENAAAASLLPWSSGGNRRAPASLNALTRGFVSAIEAHMPASIYAVLRSAGALQAFPFNEEAALAERRRGRKGVGGERAAAAAQEAAAPLTPSPSATPDPARCRVCSCPLLPAERARGGGGQEQQQQQQQWPPGSLGALDGGGAQCVCFCCERQVLDSMVVEEEENGEAGREEEKEVKEEDEMPCEAERRARRARRTRRLAALSAMLPRAD
jgi:tRNA(Ile)-lysidine synthase TilS/MesJ